jgi:hypothetical protein
MRWSRALLPIIMIGLAACSPSPPKTAQVAKPVAASSKPLGHTPQLVASALPPGPLVFHGYACGDACAIHQEGYAWAAEHEIDDPKQCHGTSEIFIEGCLAYTGVEGPFGGPPLDPSFPHVAGMF